MSDRRTGARRAPAKRHIALAAALAALAAGGALSASGLPGGESDQAKALRVLRADHDVLDRRLHAVDSTPRLSGLRLWGRAARADAARLRAESLLDDVEDPVVAQTARGAHNAMIETLAAFGELSNLDDRRLDAWNEGERRALFAVTALDAGSAAVAALDPHDPLLVDVRGADATLRRVSSRLTSTARRLARREQRVSEGRHDRRVALDRALTYANGVSTEVAAAQS